MKVVIAVDKFKGTLTAAQVAAALGRGIARVDGSVEVVAVPVADGGDGTVAAAIEAGHDSVAVAVEGPTGIGHEATYARSGDTAIIELANCCGLDLLPQGRREPMTASTSGVGQAIRHAVESGCETVILGLGGSASTDAGAGLLTALGATVSTAAGVPVAPGGGGLEQVGAVDLTAARALLRDVRLVVAGDVNNPLSGPRGAAAVYGPQKGADPAQVEQLDAALLRFARLAETGSADAAEIPPLAGEAGAGAAGGAGYAALLLGGEFRPGIEIVLDLVGLSAALEGADLVITGEGRLDEQSLHGKAPVGVARAAAARNIPVIAVAGQVAVGDDELLAAGIRSAVSLADLASVREAMERPAELLEDIGARFATRWRADGPPAPAREKEQP